MEIDLPCQLERSNLSLTWRSSSHTTTDHTDGDSTSISFQPQAKGVRIYKRNRYMYRKIGLEIEIGAELWIRQYLYYSDCSVEEIHGQAPELERNLAHVASTRTKQVETKREKKYSRMYHGYHINTIPSQSPCTDPMGTGGDCQRQRQDEQAS